MLMSRRTKTKKKAIGNINRIHPVVWNDKHPPGQGEGHQQKGTGNGPVINARQWTPIKTSKTVSTFKKIQ